MRQPRDGETLAKQTKKSYQGSRSVAFPIRKESKEKAGSQYESEAASKAQMNPVPAGTRGLERFRKSGLLQNAVGSMAG